MLTEVLIQGTIYGQMGMQLNETWRICRFFTNNSGSHENLSYSLVLHH